VNDALPVRSPAPKLALMMFLQYAALGAWVVPLSGWLGKSPEHGGWAFTSLQIAMIYATTAIGGLVAPFITGLLADRYFASEKLVRWLQLFMGACLLFCGSIARHSTGENANPSVVFPKLAMVFLAYSIACVLCLTVANSMAMRTLKEPLKSFGRVRLFGTLGWIAACLVLEFFFVPQSTDLFFVASGYHFALSIFSWWLPHTPPKGKGRPIREVMGLPATKLFRDPSFVVFAIVAFVTQIMQQFYTVFSTPFCLDLEMPHVGAMLSIAQGAEILCMATMTYFVAKIGLKATMVLGIIAWLIRNSAMMSGNLWLVIVFALPMHGISYTFFTIVAALYIDKEAPPHLRAGAQSLLTFVSSGPGNLIGFFLSGFVKDVLTKNGITDWGTFWLVPLLGCSVAMVFFLVFFHEPREPQPEAGEHTPELQPEQP
jgi:nucleoside transporter